MEKLRIAADVSHLSVKGFYDLADMAEKPFMAFFSWAKEPAAVASVKIMESMSPVKFIV